MLKLVAIILVTMLISITYGTLPGGYRDRPDLLGDENMKDLMSYTTEYLATTQNLILNEIQITRIQTQVVAGINYKINFTAKSTNGDDVTCETVIYVRFDSTKKIISAQCE